MQKLSDLLVYLKLNTYLRKVFCLSYTNFILLRIQIVVQKYSENFKYVSVLELSNTKFEQEKVRVGATIRELFRDYLCPHLCDQSGRLKRARRSVL